MKPLLTVALATAILALPAWADVKLPSIISDHMVLEKTGRVPIWGKADPGENVTVTFNGQTAKAVADKDGKWKVSLNLKTSDPGPFEMTVTGKNKLTITDIVVGEVWVASGQSNMEWRLKDTINAEEELTRSENPLLRHFTVEKTATREPQDDVVGSWQLTTPANGRQFSGVGYYFSKTLQNQLKAPVGLIHSSWGATPSETWTSAEALDTVPDLKECRERFWKFIENYPSDKEAFIKNMDAWTKETGREDRPVTDAAAYAGEHVSTEGWTTVKLPGVVTGEGLPEAGVVWLRREFEAPTAMGVKLPLFIPVDGFESVYWNGELLKQTTYRDFPGTGNVRRYGPLDIPRDKIKPGQNVLAIRIYEPVAPARFPAAPAAGTVSLAGNWQARAEFSFPPLDAAKLAAAPPLQAEAPVPQKMPAYLFNGMINPLIPYAIRGVIWYQGEGNSSRAFQYRTAFPLLIEDWRKQWGQADFPFYFCQLANFNPKKPVPGDSALAELREAQLMTLKLPNTGQAVLIDIGEAGDIHPRNKKDVGERLARIALAKDYGKSIVWSGPVYRSMKVDGNKIVLTFDHTDGGLVAKPLPKTFLVATETNATAPLVPNSPGSQVEGFAICGEDRKWVWADAKIQGKTVIVWSDEVPKPVAVRYGWQENPTCNLYNGADLPASPFRTDDFPPLTLKAKY